jgi:hypothetical protein
LFNIADHAVIDIYSDEIALELIKKYSMVWKCCWSFIEIDNKGIVKKIQLFDINDINFIRDKLNINK